MTGAIIRGEEHFFASTYSGNGQGQRVGTFVPYTDNGTISKSCMFESGDTADKLQATIGTSSTSNARRKMTISMWYKWTGTGGNYQTLWTVGGDGQTPYLACYINNNGSRPKGGLTFFDYTGSGSSYNSLIETKAGFRDTSKWYHVVFSMDTTQSTDSDRFKIYVDGNLQATDTNNYYSENFDTGFGTNVAYAYGTNKTVSSGSYWFNGYLAEINHVDGTAYGPETFGVTDTSTGRWIPKSLGSITYGDNGHRLHFANSAGQTIGDDLSGNGNDFTVSDLAAFNVRNDTPTNNLPTMRPYNPSYPTTQTKGNMTYTAGGTNQGYPMCSTLAPDAGKWYAEVRTSSNGGGNVITIGIYIQEDMHYWDNSYNFYPGAQMNNGDGCGVGMQIRNDGQRWLTSSLVGSTVQNNLSGTAVAAGDVFGIAVDRDNSLVTFYANNGSSLGSASILRPGRIMFTAMAVTSSDTWTWNFGDNPTFDGNETAGGNADEDGNGNFYHSVPSGFKMLRQDSMPENSKGIPDLVWIKNRDSTDGHQVYDSTRGPLEAQRTDTEVVDATTNDGLQKFLKGGFEIEDDVATNTADEQYVAWNWVANGGTTSANSDGSGATLASTIQANQTAGFSIVTYTGDGNAGRKVAHGLSQAPDWIWITGTSIATGPKMYHHKNTAAPETDYLALSTTDATYDAIFLNDTAPDAKCFTLGPTGYATNNASKTYVAYCWHEVPGFSKFGSYTGNANADGPFVYLGFKPAWILFKAMNSANYYITDNKMFTFNPNGAEFHPNTTNAQTTLAGGRGVDYLSNGFKVRQESGYGYNYSGVTTLYWAFAEHPFNGDGENAFATAK